MLDIRKTMVKSTPVLIDDQRGELEKLLKKILDATLKRLDKKG
jgi:BMFP domain-containing protein YqiC